MGLSAATKIFTLVIGLMLGVNVVSAVDLQDYDDLDAALGVGLSSGLRTQTNERTGSAAQDPSDPDVIQRVAENIAKVKTALSGRFSLADDVVFGMYILRYLSDLGDQDLVNSDIQSLVTSLEALTGEEFDKQLKDMLAQIKMVRFGHNKNQRYIRVYANNSDGILVPINSTMNEGGTVEEVEFLKIKDKAKISFEDVESKRDNDWLKNFIKSKAKFLLLFPLKMFNLVHTDTVKAIDTYLQIPATIKPLRLKFSNIFVRVKTKTLFKNMDFNIKRGMAIAGLSGANGPVPPVVFEARAGLISIKTSLDQ